jgi:hypothetical protein
MQLPEYTPSGIATNFLAQDAFKKSLTVSQLQAALCAIVRHGKISDGLQDDTRKSNGLHPMYFELHKDDGNKQDIKELIHDTMADAFNGVSLFVSMACTWNQWELMIQPKACRPQ